MITFLYVFYAEMDKKNPGVALNLEYYNGGQAWIL